MKLKVTERAHIKNSQKLFQDMESIQSDIPKANISTPSSKPLKKRLKMMV